MKIDVELSDFMTQKRAIVVHFSHHANMRDDGIFPDDLINAIANRHIWPLSCSVVWPGHSMDVVGSVGVIFEPTLDSVLCVSNMDAGSYVLPDGTDQSGGVPLTADSLAATFEVVGTYNEWRLRGAEVAGIFVLNSNNIMVKRPMEFDVNGTKFQTITAQKIELADVFAAFPSMKIYTMGAAGRIEISPSAHLSF